MKQWTMLAYLAGDNNLDSAGVEDMAEMAKVGSTPNVDVVVQFDRAGKKAVTARYHISKGGGGEKDRVMVLPETNTGDPKVLIDFIAWGVQNYPAQHYLLVLWNHGSGWSEDNVYRHTGITRRDLSQPKALTRSPLRRALFSTTIEQVVRPNIRGIAYDDSARDFLDNAELKKCLQAAYAQTGGRKVDVLGFDACLMNMVEVGYQLKDSVAITVGSEETEPGAGWPYDLILSTLAKKPSLTPVQLGQTIVQQYYQSYVNTSEAVTQSALNLARIDGLAEAVDRLADALKANLTANGVQGAIGRMLRDCQRFYYPDYLDLYDMARLLRDYTAVPAIKTAAQGVMNVLRTSATKGVVVAQKHLGASVARARGISIYFPRDDVSPFYSHLDYAGHRWDEFLKAYHTARLQPERRKGRSLER
jgi:hypothetical protein